MARAGDCATAKIGRLCRRRLDRYTVRMATTDARGQPARVYKDIVPDQNADDRFFIDTLPRIASYTMTLTNGVEAAYALFQAVRYVVQNRIAGDIVECGVWKGGSMMLVAYALQHFG